ncbi:MAG: nucleotide exchange factor GrpE [Actinomycetes bacterium]
MTEPFRHQTSQSEAQGAGDEALQQEGPVVRDRRRLDPETGQVRHPEAQPDHDAATSAPQSDGVREALTSTPAADDEALAGAAAQLAAERLEDLQRLQAEFVNYRKRVDRDRDVARESAIAGFVEAMLPVLDDIYFARQHGDLTDGPFAAIAEKLEGVLSRYGVERYCELGEEFDPLVHEALMHTHSPDVQATTVTTVMQPGYKVGDKVLRPARVGVSDPE